MPTLVLSARHSEDNQALWRAAIRAGWSVERIQGIRVPAEVHTQDVVLYVESLFAPAIAQQLGVELLEAPEDWLVRLPFWTSRSNTSTPPPPPVVELFVARPPAVSTMK